MVANVDVLGALVKLGVLGQRDRALVVFVDSQSFVACFLTEFTHKRLKPHRFLSRFRQRHVLCLDRRERHAALLLDTPADAATVEHEHVITGTASRLKCRPPSRRYRNRSACAGETNAECRSRLQLS